jgi:exonuclease III
MASDVLKWDAIRDRITESQCDIVCLQETKRDLFDSRYIKNFCPSTFDSFLFLPSVGNSGGIIIIWKLHCFEGTLAFINEFSLTVELRSKHNNTVWILSNIYATCTSGGKKTFVD